MSAFRRKIIYDRIVTRFSPEGRLLQVEYALECVKRGATIMGLICSEGVVLGAEEPIRDELQNSESSWKIYELDEHVGVTIAGLGADARFLVDQARIYAQNNWLIYDEPIDVEILTKRIGDIKQRYTQRIAVRPFGVSFIIGGVDKTGNKVFKTDPSGSYRRYKAVVEGVGKKTVEGILKKEYREGLTLNDAVKLAIKCFFRDFEARGKKSRIRLAVIPIETKRFTVLPESHLNKYKEATGLR